MAHAMNLTVNAAAQRAGVETTVLRLNVAHLLMVLNVVHAHRMRNVAATRDGVASIAMVSGLRPR
jgi:hypothetical protein